MKYVQGLDRINKQIVKTTTGNFFTTTYNGVIYIFNYKGSVCRVRDIDIEGPTATSSFKHLQKKRKERSISLDDKKLKISNRLFKKILNACENKAVEHFLPFDK